MDRLRAFLLLLFYTAFSAIAVASGHLDPEKLSEGTEKEAFGSLFTGQIQGNAIKLPGKTDSSKQSVFSWDSRLASYETAAFLLPANSTTNTNEPGLPFRIMYCVYRL